MKRARGLLIGLIFLGALGAYGWLGLFQIEPDEQAVVLLLGRHVRDVEPGLHWYALGAERVEKRRVTTTLEEEFGYRTLNRGPPPEYEDRPDERRMLTQEEYLVDLEFVVQYRIRNLGKYLFNVKDVPSVIRDVSQAAMREVVATSSINAVLYEDKSEFQRQTKGLIQRVLDRYDAGIQIQSVQLQDVEAPEPVKEAFADVISAQQDKERLILEAGGYADQVVPRARGEAQEAIYKAQAYKATRVLESRGEAERFKAILTEYERAPRVTRERLYLETLEAILPKMEKVIIEEGHAERVLPYLPIGRKALGTP